MTCSNLIPNHWVNSWDLTFRDSDETVERNMGTMSYNFRFSKSTNIMYMNWKCKCCDYAIVHSMLTYCTRQSVNRLIQRSIKSASLNWVHLCAKRKSWWINSLISSIIIPSRFLGDYLIWFEVVFRIHTRKIIRFVLTTKCNLFSSWLGIITKVRFFSHISAHTRQFSVSEHVRCKLSMAKTEFSLALSSIGRFFWEV